MEEALDQFFACTDIYIWISLLVAVVVPHIFVFRVTYVNRKLSEELNSAKEALLLTRKERRSLRSQIRKKR